MATCSARKEFEVNLNEVAQALNNGLATMNVYSVAMAHGDTICVNMRSAQHGEVSATYKNTDAKEFLRKAAGLPKTAHILEFKHGDTGRVKVVAKIHLSGVARRIDDILEEW